MKLTSILAIYALFWTLSLFVILPIGVKTSEEMGEKSGKGHADSAPHRHDLKRKAVWTTMLSAGLFALFYANYVYGWVTLDNIPMPEPQGFQPVK
jgi:predicted secreted protein